MSAANRLGEMSRLLDDSVETHNEQNEDINVCDKPRSGHLLPQLAATVVVSWLSIVVGFASAYSSPAESTMVQELNLTRTEASWICSLLPVGALLGSLFGGPSVECLGRKSSLVLTDAVFLLAWSVNLFSGGVWTMYASRLLSGCGVGVASFAVPVYLAETLEPEIRGRLGLFPTAFGNFGILLCFVAGNALEWRGLAAIGVALTLPFLAAIWAIPETPRWYVSRGRAGRARAALQWLRGGDRDVGKELEALKSGDGKPKKFTRLHVRVFAIVLGLMFFQQFSGINAVIFYTTQIFEESGSSLDASVCTAVVGAVNFVATFVAAVLVDRLGRKVLLYVSGAVMAGMLFLLGVYFFLLKVERVDLKAVEWLPLTCFVLYVLGFSFGFGPVPWLMMGEVLPAAVRGPAASVCASFNWTCTFVITKSFPLLVDSIGVHCAFWFFGVVMLLSLLFLRLFVPETKKRTLEDIERMMTGN